MPECGPADGGRDQHRPGQAGEVGVAIRRDLRPGLHEAEHGGDDGGVAHPRHHARRPAAPGEDEEGRDPRHRDEAQHVARRRRVEPPLEEIGGRQAPGHDRLPEVEGEPVGRLRGALEGAVLRQRAHRGLVLLGHEGERRGAEGERCVRHLLQEPRRPP